MENRINSNRESLRAQRELANTTERRGRSELRLATGRRIASAADDPSGQGIAERMRSQIRSLSSTIENSSRGFAVIDTANGALSEVDAGLSRLRELAVQASNGTLSAEDRASINAEAQGLAADIDALSANTNAGGVPVLDGTTTDVQVGTEAGDAVSLPAVDASAASLGIDALDLSSAAGASDAIGALDGAVSQVAGFRADLGAAARQLSSAQESSLQSRDELLASESQLTSLDVAVEAAIMAQQRLLSNAGVSSLTQANTQPQRALALLQ